MAVQLGDIAPDFEQDTINGSIRFHEWMGRSWCILFSQPSASEPAKAEETDEFAQMARLKPEWNRRGVKVVGLSVHSSVLDFRAPMATSRRSVVGRSAPIPFSR